MPVLEMESGTRPGLSERVALVAAQLRPIHSRADLLDSYRRESLCRLGSAPFSGSAAEVIELAYAIRWAQLEAEEGLLWQAPIETIGEDDD